MASDDEQKAGEEEEEFTNQPSSRSHARRSSTRARSEDSKTSDRNTMSKLNPGDKVRYSHDEDGGEWVTGTIARRHRDGTYTINNDDGEKAKNVARAKIQLVKAKSKSPSKGDEEEEEEKKADDEEKVDEEEDGDGAIRRGSTVEVYDSGRWRLALVEKLRKDDSMLVTFKDGFEDTKRKVDGMQVRLARQLAIGESVLAQDENQMWRSARIEKRRSPDAYDILYLDTNERERKVPRYRLRESFFAACCGDLCSSISKCFEFPSPIYQPGQIVEVLSQETRQWRPAKIVKRREKDNTYDVSFNAQGRQAAGMTSESGDEEEKKEEERDTRTEARVPATRIRLRPLLLQLFDAFSSLNCCSCDFNFVCPVWSRYKELDPIQYRDIEGRWHDAVIGKVRENNQYDVKYNWDEVERKVDSSRLRMRIRPPAVPEGALVDVAQDGKPGTFLEAKVTRVHLSGDYYDVSYASGKKEQRVPQARVCSKTRRYRPGMKVAVEVPDGKGGASVKEAEIIWVHSNGALSVETQDGARLLNLSPTSIVTSQHHRSSLTDFEAMTLGLNYVIELAVYLIFLYISIVQLDAGWSFMHYATSISDLGSLGLLFTKNENMQANSSSTAFSNLPLLTDELWLGSSLAILCLLAVFLMVASTIYFYKVYRSLERREEPERLKPYGRSRISFYDIFSAIMLCTCLVVLINGICYGSLYNKFSSKETNLSTNGSFDDFQVGRVAFKYNPFQNRDTPASVIELLGMNLSKCCLSFFLLMALYFSLEIAEDILSRMLWCIPSIALSILVCTKTVASVQVLLSVQNITITQSNSYQMTGAMDKAVTLLCFTCWTSGILIYAIRLSKYFRNMTTACALRGGDISKPLLKQALQGELGNEAREDALKEAQEKMIRNAGQVTFISFSVAKWAVVHIPLSIAAIALNSSINSWASEQSSTIKASTFDSLEQYLTVDIAISAGCLAMLVLCLLYVQYVRCSDVFYQGLDMSFRPHNVQDALGLSKATKRRHSNDADEREERRSDLEEEKVEEKDSS